MIVKIQILTILFALGALGTLEGQGRTLNTQFINNKLSINPAYAGTNNSVDFTLLHRSQWVGINGAPTAQVFSINLPSLKENLGFGLNINRLSFGINQLLDLSLPYSYSFVISDYKVKFGSSINLKSYNEDYTKSLTTIDDRTLDTNIPSIGFNARSINFGLGVYISNKTSFFGLSTPTLTKDIQFADNGAIIPTFRTIDIMVGHEIKLTPDTKLLVQSMGRIANNYQSILDFNAGIELNQKITFGIGTRLGNPVVNSVTANAGFVVQSAYLGFAYDYPLSQLRGQQIGSFELVAYYAIKLKKSKYEGISPRFF
jgi:type IX secretion system PorP/SprF family membrane protein